MDLVKIFCCSPRLPGGQEPSGQNRMSVVDSKWLGIVVAPLSPRLKRQTSGLPRAHSPVGEPPGGMTLGGGLLARLPLPRNVQIHVRQQSRTDVVEQIPARGDASVSIHTMGTSLERYLRIKVHQEVLRRPYDAITVTGLYRRSRPSIVFEGEKSDKPFNWQRPTASLIEDGYRLQIECFPGNDHVQHYAEIIAAYLGHQHQQDKTCLDLTPPSRVFFAPCSCSDTQAALRASNLKKLPDRIDTVILGLVHKLDRLTGGSVKEWEGGEDECFGWVIRQIGGKTVAFLGFRPSFWGDISGQIVYALAAARPHIRTILYFGKLGVVRPGIRPNTRLATGSFSLVRGRPVEWTNVLSESVESIAREHTIVGNHITVPSVLHETKEWLAGLPGTVDFVDPEVGMMAEAAVMSGISFGYLHIVSDNVAEKYTEDLSNERLKSVLERRAGLYEVAQDVLEHHLSREMLA